MSKIISFSKQKQIDGINKVVDCMKITIGPKGRNISLTNGDTVNDGRRIAEDITLKDFTENKGAERVKRLVRKVSQDVGGGRTATAILFQELIKVGMDLLNRGFNFNQLKKGMQLAVKDIHEQLDKMSIPVKGKLKEVATISTESEELGKVIGDIMEKVGKDGIVTTTESNTFGISCEREDGLKFDRGYISPWMATDNKGNAEYKDIPVFITDKKISSFGDVVPLLDTISSTGKKNLFIIAEDFSDEALKFTNIGRAQGTFNIIAIKTPGLGDNKKFCLEDLCALTRAELVQESLWDSYFETKQGKHQLTGQLIQIKVLKKEILGNANNVISTKDSTKIIGSNVKTWITTLKTRCELTDNKWEKDQFQERIAKLQNGIAVIKVGASSEDEVKYLKLKIEDGVNESKRALESGIVMGGNVAFIHASKTIVPRTQEDNELLQGFNIVIKSLEAPLCQIVENSADSPDVIVDKIRKSDSLTVGYNSLDNEVVDDMYKLGIIDATKVVKTVLEYAVNEAILFLSLGGDISEEVIESK